MGSEKHHFVIVGGGVAGILLATRLGRWGKADVTLIDHATAHVWKPMLHTFAAGTANAYQQRISFVAHGANAGFRYLPGSLESIDRQARQLTMLPLLSATGEVILNRRSIGYDTLILSVGSKANDFDTQGVADHCLFIDDLRQAETFNTRFYESLLRTAHDGRPLGIAIVGGGATGVELASEISHLADIAASYDAGGLRPAVEISLVESGPRLLAAFPETVAAAAFDQLTRLGIRVLTSTKVVAADAGGLILGNGSRLDAALKVWAAGVKAPDAIAGLQGLEHSRSGQIVVRPSLQVGDDHSLFAIGDCASLTPAGSERPLPPTAQVARQQAMHLARHLPRRLAGKDVPPFVFRDMGSLVSLSRYNAFGTLGRHGIWGNGFIRGRFAQLSHAMLYRLHQAEVHGLVRAARLWVADAISSGVRPNVRVD